jgi:biotin-dependent carboxylase-like uncharacterized protein
VTTGSGDEATAAIEVLAPGLLTVVEDLGRPGWAHLGVPRAGAADGRSLRLANRLVGNPEGAAALEVTVDGPRLRFRRTGWVAVCGAPVDVAVDGRPAPTQVAVPVPAGAVLGVGRVWAGLRCYLAVRGGIAVPPVLGSRSTDTVGGLGPAPVRAGDLLPVGTEVVGPVWQEPVPGVALPVEPLLRVVPGPREDWFPDSALRVLTSTAWEVTAASDRTGLRLAGPALPRATPHRELASEGMVPGALQVPPDGRPILFLANAPTTGGYPVIAVVVDADLPFAGQVPPGHRVRFTRCPPPFGADR